MRKTAGGELVKVYGYTFFVSLVGEGVCLINQCFLICLDLTLFLVLCSWSLRMMGLVPLDVTCCLCLSAFCT